MGDLATPSDLRLVAEFRNSLDIESGQDHLTNFPARHDLGLSDEELAGVRELREGLRSACLAHAGVPVPDERLTALNGLCDAARLTVRLDAAGRATLAPAAGLGASAVFTARIAAIIALAEREGTWQRLKVGEAPDCQWAYYDRSQAGRRRWCSMRVCGSRAKMRAYRAKNAAKTNRR